MSRLRHIVLHADHLLSSGLSRRQCAARFTLLLAGWSRAALDVDANSNKRQRRRRKQRKRNKMVMLCNQGQTIEVSRKQQDAFLADGATRGACACLETTEDVQAAVDMAAPGATIELCRGRWLLSQTIVIAKDLTLSGAGSEQTILDGGDSVRVLRIDTGAVTLRGLTITGGSARTTVDRDGGGVFTLGSLTVIDCSIRGNVAGHRGGGIYNGFGNVAITRSIIADNSAELGGGIFHPTHVLTVTNSRIERNGAIFGAGVHNGGIAIGSLPGEGQTELRAGCVIQGNMAAGQGGGLFIASGRVTLHHSSVIQNSAPDGGGAYTNWTGTLEMAGNSTVANNQVNNCAGFRIPETCFG